MLLLGSRLIKTPVMSLQTGARLAHTAQPVIDPSNLHIVAYQVEGPLLTEAPSFLRTADIREYGRLGMIINGSDEFVGLNDVIKIKEIHDLKFNLIGMQVLDEHKHKLGKIDDYTLDTLDFVIQQLNVKRGLIRGITDTGLLVNRSQILEINNTSVIVKSPTIKSVEPVMQAMRTEYVNPFRSTKPQQTKQTIDKS